MEDFRPGTIIHNLGLSQISPNKLKLFKSEVFKILKVQARRGTGNVSGIYTNTALFSQRSLSQRISFAGLFR